jgi:hypothetical protein
MARRLPFWAVSLGLASTAAPAAHAAPTTFSLELHANDCSTTDQQLASAILTRVPDATRVEGAAEVGILAELWNHGSSSIKVTLAQGESQREFPGASCEEASAIIAFITALVLDARPEDRLKATEQAGVPQAESPAAAPPEPAKLPPPEPEPITPTTHTDVAAAAPRRTPPRFGVNAALALETAVAPTPPLGGLFGVSVSWPRPSVLTPEIRAALLVTGSSSEPADVGEVRFSLIAGRLSACPVRPTLLDGALVLGACATFDAGSLHAQGDSRVGGKPSPMPWLAGGAGLVAEVRLNPSFQLELQAGAKLLFIHDTFTLKPDPAVMTEQPAPRLPVYEVPLFSAGFSLGVGFAL